MHIAQGSTSVLVGCRTSVPGPLVQVLSSPDPTCPALPVQQRTSSTFGRRLRRSGRRGEVHRSGADELRRHGQADMLFGHRHGRYHRGVKKLGRRRPRREGPRPQGLKDFQGPKADECRLTQVWVDLEVDHWINRDALITFTHVIAS